MSGTGRVGGALRAVALAGAVAAVLAGCASGTGAGSLGPGSSGTGGSTAPASPGDSPTLTPPPTPSPGTVSGGTAVLPSATPVPAGSLTADLTVSLDETGSGAAQTWRLTCGPDGGDHPDPAAACAALAAAGGAAAFAPPRTDLVCTEQYGGPQKAHVEGTVGGTKVGADFSRTDGCGIARWNPLAPLLGSAGGV